MTDIKQLATEDVSGTTLAPPHGVAFNRINEVIVAVNAQVNAVAVAVCTQLPVQTDEAEVTGDINGVAAKQFVPTEVVLEVTSVTGTVAADGTINVGTATGGDSILSAQALTGLNAVGNCRRIPLSEDTTAIAGNATLYANVESADSTVTTLELAVHVFGRQV